MGNGVPAVALAPGLATAEPAVIALSLPGLGDNALAWLLLIAVLIASTAFVVRISGRLLGHVENVVFTNWRLALLGLTGIVLSLASGWTTWDGMRNFTGEPLLSFLITFGIQGVMLIVAWLIGETFATGMNAQRHGGGFAGSLANVFKPYLAAIRIVFANIVLWVMFLACMATSVFFSFDSLFSTIFPQKERARAALLRAESQVGGLIAELGVTINAERLRQSQALLATEAWQTYSAGLEQMTRRAAAAREDLNRHFQTELEESQRAIAAQQERKATAESQKAGLDARKNRIMEDLSRLQAQRPGLTAEVREQEDTVLNLERRIETQRINVLAEERGIGGSGRAGRGSKWRAEKALEDTLKAQAEIARSQLASRKARLTEADAAIAGLRSELATLDGELAKLTGEARTAASLASAAEAQRADNAGKTADPTAILPALEEARNAFRQSPTEGGLRAIQDHCRELASGLTATGIDTRATGEEACDVKRVAEAGVAVFALNVGLASFSEQCAPGDRIGKRRSTTSLFRFVRTCLADSGLPSGMTEEFRAKLNLAELNRDDRAHRFVVTWNAFTDGNRLAHLALGIAIAIDALVFMSGLFGANAIRSPLQDVPGARRRSARHLEDIIDNALLPNRYLNASAALDAMHPIAGGDGFTQEIVLAQVGAEASSAVTKLLNAGSTIGAVERRSDANGFPERALIRGELFEYLSIVAKREMQGTQEHAQIAQVQPALVDALRPKVGDHAQMVLLRLRPHAEERQRFSAIVDLDEARASELPVLNSFLIAGAAHGLIEQWQSTPGGAEPSPDRPRRAYLIDRLLHKALLGVARVHPAISRREGEPQSMPPLLPPVPRFLADRSKKSGSGTAVVSTAGPSSGAPAVENSGVPTPIPEASETLPGTDTPSEVGGEDGRPLQGEGGSVSPSPSLSDLGADDVPFVFTPPEIPPRAAKQQTGDDRGALQASNERRDEKDADARLVDHVASSLGLPSEALQDVLAGGMDFQTDALNEAMDRVIALDGRLRQQVQQAVARNTQLLSDLPQSLPEEVAAHAAKGSMFEDLLQRPTLLLLLPNGAYRLHLADWMAELGAADGGNPASDILLGGLAQHGRELEQADLGTAAGWDSIARSLEDFALLLADRKDSGGG